MKFWSEIGSGFRKPGGTPKQEFLHPDKGQTVRGRVQIWRIHMNTAPFLQPTCIFKFKVPDTKMQLAGIYRIQRVISLLMFFTGESLFKAKVTELTHGHSSRPMNILYIKINKLRIKSKTSLFMWGSSNIFYER